MPVSFANALVAPGSPKAANNDAFYKVVQQGAYQGVKIVNVYYYRVGLGLLPFGLNFGGAEALASTFRNQVWSNKIRDIMPTTFKLETIVVYPYNGAFDPVTNLPFTLTVNEYGTAVQANMGPANCCIVALNMEGTVLGANGWFPPKRGYCAFGPLREGDVDEQGRLTGTAQQFYFENCEAMGQDLYNPFSLVTFWPIRISARKILGVLTLRGFTDVSGITVRSIVKWRRSRIVEA